MVIIAFVITIIHSPTRPFFLSRQEDKGETYWQPHWDLNPDNPLQKVLTVLETGALPLCYGAIYMVDRVGFEPTLACSLGMCLCRWTTDLNGAHRRI